MQLREQVAIVTAGAAGLGRHISNALAGEGAHVVVGDLDPDAGAETVTHVERAGGSATFVPVDVGDDEQLARLVSAATRCGTLRALVNNAGGWGPVWSRTGSGLTGRSTSSPR